MPLEMEKPTTTTTSGSGIMYFGYGAMVNPVSRARRGVETVNERPAILEDYRLTFAYGGAANIMFKRGYQVHGVLMECKAEKDWQLLKDFDAGYECVDVDVYPYDSDEDEDPVKAHIFSMGLSESNTSKLPPEKLPQERYIRIIATGMRRHGVDEEYVDYSIMNSEYVPSRKPNEYLTFPQKISGRGKEKVIPYNDYVKKAKKKAWFLIGNRVIQLGEHDPNSPMVQMLMARIVGKQDCTFDTMQALYDPDLPACETREDVQPIHIAWTENQLVEQFEQADLSAMAVGVVKKEPSSSSSRSLAGRLTTSMKKFSINK